MFINLHDDSSFAHNYHRKKQTRFLDSRSCNDINYNGNLHRNRLASRMVSSHNINVGCLVVGYENTGFDNGKITSGDAGGRVSPLIEPMNPASLTVMKG